MTTETVATAATIERPGSPRTALPVLWIAGAPGAGKSATAWKVHEQAAGEQVAHVDIDQLTMLEPGPEDSFALAVTTLGELVDAHLALGTRALIVSGVIDPEQVPALEAGLHGRAEVTWCLVDAEDDVLRARVSARGWPEELVERVLDDARAWRAAEGIDLHRLDTTAATVPEIAERAVRLLALRPTATPEEPAEPETATDPGPTPGPATGTRPTAGPGPSTGDADELVVLFGPRAVGKSSLSWGLFMARAGRGEATGYLDADQLGIVHGHPVQRDRLLHRAVTAIAHAFAEAGAVRTLVNGNLSPALVAALDGPRSILIRLDAPEAVLEARIARRHGGDEARLGGDDLVGALPEAQAAALDRARHQREEHAAAAMSTHVLDVAEDDREAHVRALDALLP